MITPSRKTRKVAKILLYTFIAGQTAYQLYTVLRKIEDLNKD